MKISAEWFWIIGIVMVLITISTAIALELDSSQELLKDDTIQLKSNKELKINDFASKERLIIKDYGKETTNHYIINVEKNGKPYRLIVSKQKIEDSYARK